MLIMSKELPSHYRDFILFYSVLFFTCLIGIIELLPEFESLKSVVTWHGFSLSSSILHKGFHVKRLIPLSISRVRLKTIEEGTSAQLQTRTSLKSS